MKNAQATLKTDKQCTTLFKLNSLSLEEVIKKPEHTWILATNNREWLPLPLLVLFCSKGPYKLVR